MPPLPPMRGASTLTQRLSAAPKKTCSVNQLPCGVGRTPANGQRQWQRSRAYPRLPARRPVDSTPLRPGLPKYTADAAYPRSGSRSTAQAGSTRRRSTAGASSLTRMDTVSVSSAVTASITPAGSEKSPSRSRLFKMKHWCSTVKWPSSIRRCVRGLICSGNPIRASSRRRRSIWPSTCSIARARISALAPLRERRPCLEEIIAGHDLVLPARRLAPNGLEAWAQVLEQGYEGYVGKDEASQYLGGKTTAWLKVKVPGWTDSEDRWKRVRPGGQARRLTILLITQGNHVT